MNIPRKFYNVNEPGYPVVVTNVGELKEVLAELPDNLSVQLGFSNNGVEVIVYNMSPKFGPPHLELRERETEDDDELEDD